MTSDAKVGLLLGLFFIFVIAFIINGLPRFRNKTDSNELTTNMTTFDDDSLGIGARERKTQKTLDWMERVEKQALSEVREFSKNEEDIRSVTPLPESFSAAKESNKSEEIEPTFALVHPSPVTAKETEVLNPKSFQSTWPKTYVVSKDDSLASIAKKFYGTKEGNRRINISRIFEANRKVLKSADEIYVGQKLIIPSPAKLASTKDRLNSGISGTLFEKIKSIGRKHISTNDKRAQQGKLYTVREGDSLWKIAAEQLGNGSRFSEIGVLNADILDDEDILVVGMQLKIPTR
jgi:nucleoid-associated protein YgaU